MSVRSPSFIELTSCINGNIWAAFRDSQKKFGGFVLRAAFQQGLNMKFLSYAIALQSSLFLVRVDVPYKQKQANA
ncbi:hypothetical protein [Microbulbifer sp.]|uniref:hypothetical protein n=1 Tax=Microbulbifer sp. TaxID=1908541 RepID=UPI003F3E1593